MDLILDAGVSLRAVPRVLAALGHWLADTLWLPDWTRARWWWRNAARLWREGHVFMPGPQAPHILRRLGDFGALSSPYFELARVFRGLPPSRGRSNGVDMSRGGRRAAGHTGDPVTCFEL